MLITEHGLLELAAFTCRRSWRWCCSASWCNRTLSTSARTGSARIRTFTCPFSDRTFLCAGAAHWPHAVPGAFCRGCCDSLRLAQSWLQFLDRTWPAFKRILASQTFKFRHSLIEAAMRLLNFPASCCFCASAAGIMLLAISLKRRMFFFLSMNASGGSL